MNSELMSFGQMIWNRVGYLLVPYHEMGVWGWILSILFVGLTIAWLWRWKPWGKDPLQVIGQVVGPFVVIAFALMVGFAFVWKAIGIVQGLVAGAITQLVFSIPGLGWVLQKLWPGLGNAIAGLIVAVVGFAFMIGIIWYLVKNAGNAIKSIFDAMIGIFKGSKEGHEVKTSYKVAGVVGLAALINQPDWNQWEMFGLQMPLISIVSALFGAGVLVYTTTQGQEAVAKTKGKVTGGLLPDGGHYCGNRGMMPLYDKKAWSVGKRKPLLDDEGNPRFKYVAHCGHLVLKDEDRCGSHQCDNWSYFLPWDCECGQKGLSWEKEKCPKCGAHKPQRPWCCPKCRYNGKKDQGIPWKIPTCPKCHTARPPRPTTPFHYPWDDVHQSAPEPTTPKAKAKGKKATEATAPRPAPKAAAGKWQCKALVDLRTEKGFVPQRKPDGSLVLGADGKPLRKKGPCGHKNSVLAKFCEHCGSPKGTTGASSSPPSGGVVSCPHCGSSVSAGVKFCRHCTKSLGPEPPPAVMPPIPPQAASRPDSHRTAVTAPPPRPRQKRRPRPMATSDIFRR